MLGRISKTGGGESRRERMGGERLVGVVSKEKFLTKPRSIPTDANEPAKKWRPLAGENGWKGGGR